MKNIMPFFALLCSLLSLLFTIWIIARAPSRVFWLTAIVTGEWSLFFGLVALIGAGCGIVAIKSAAPVSGYIAVGSGAIAFLISLYPLLVMLPVASANGVNLSLKKYASFKTASPIAPIRTFAFSEVEGNPLSLDVYGVSSEEAKPAVVVVHGGSWNGGSRSDFPKWNHWLVDQGYVVFDIDYRLAPQPNWQTATQDVRDAVVWIKTRADQFGIDPERMAILGRSAGGQLALQAAYTAEEDTSSSSQNTQVQAVIAFYAPADLQWGYENPAFIRVNDGSAQLRAFTGGTPETVPDVYKQASPLTHVSPSTPPTLLIHGEKDQLVGTHHTVTLNDVLQKQPQGADKHKVLYIPYGQHGFDYNFNGWGSQVTQAVLAEHLAFHLRAIK